MPTVGQQLKAFDTIHPSGVRSLQLKPPGSGAGSPELGFLRSSAVNAPPTSAPASSMAPLRSNETLLSTSESGSVADLSGRARVTQMLDDAFGTDEELAAEDPRDVALDNAKKEAALETFQIVQPGQKLPIRGGEARERAALEFEADLDTRRGTALQKELDTLDQEQPGPTSADQQLVGELHMRLQGDPQFQKLTPEQKNSFMYDKLIEAKKLLRERRRRNILMKYELASTGQVNPQYTE